MKATTSILSTCFVRAVNARLRCRTEHPQSPAHASNQRNAIKRIAILNLLAIGVFFLFALAWSHAGRASVILVDFLPSDPFVGVVAVDSGDDACSLREALVAANSAASFNECIPIGNPLDPLVVRLPVTAPTFTLFDAPYAGSDFEDFGPNGLPVVTGTYAIVGNGAVIQRDPATSTPKFRLLQVVQGATLDISDLSFEHGWAAGQSGDNFDQGGCLANTGTLHMTEVNVSSCIAENEGGYGGYGGGIYNDNGTLVMTGGSVNDNRTRVADDSGAAGFGGGIFNLGTATLTGVTVSGNRVGGSAGAGGGIYNAVTLTLVGCNITGNDANWNNSAEPDTHRGGGIVNAGGTLTVTDTVISNNHARLGGGLAAFGNNNFSTTVSGSTISQNQAYDGGGLMLEGPDAVVVLDGSTVDGNSAARYGGGLQILQGSVLVSNTTISGNDADLAAGIYIDDDQDVPLLELDYVTLAGNNGTFAMYVPGGEVRVGHSVLATPGGDTCATAPDGNITSLGYNLNDDSSCGFMQASDVIGVNPQLAPLANNGGGTYTMLPLPSSPLIDAIPVFDCATNVPTGADASVDQRGVARPQAYGCDIGAVELEPSAATLLAYGGSGQHSMTGDPFAWPLVVQARDAQGRAVAGLPLNIDTPTSGPSATCSPSTTDATGVLLTYCTANMVQGSYTVNISVPLSRTVDGVSLQQDFALANDFNDRIFGDGFDGSPLLNISMASGQRVLDTDFDIPQGLLAERIEPILLVHDAQDHRVVLVEARRNDHGTRIRIVEYDAKGYPAHFGDWQEPAALRMRVHLVQRSGSVSSSLHAANQ